MTDMLADARTSQFDAAPAQAPASVPDAARTLDAALARGLAGVRARQRGDGSWAGVLSSSALATSIAIVGLALVDAVAHRVRITRGRRWLLAAQHADGGWGDATGDPSNINATSLAIAALTFTHPADGAPAELEVERTLARARACLEGFGGYAAVGDPARCTLSGPCRTVAALAGILDWQRIKLLRPEVILLPQPLRRTISTTFPAYLSISLLHSVMAPRPLNALPTYRRARREVLGWLARAQGPNGSFEESAFLTSVIIACLTAAGEGDQPWLAPAVAFVLASQRADGGWPIDRDLETFDTDLAVFAFAEAHEAVPQAEAIRSWLLARQWATDCFPTSARPGGWSWAMPAGWPDTDDSSYTLLALLTLGEPPASAAIQRGAGWLAWMQNRDGSWSTFVRNSSMPFDHACPYIVGHVLCALQASGYLERHPTVLRRALAYLARAQRYDGSFGSVWFREATAGTASVLEALADCGLGATEMAARARAHLLRSQNDDGGWAGLRGHAATAEESAWAVLALARGPATEETYAAVRRGVAWLLARQRPDGLWDEAPIGLYYSAMWYSDSAFAAAIPLRALARAREFLA